MIGLFVYYLIISIPVAVLLTISARILLDIKSVWKSLIIFALSVFLWYAILWTIIVLCCIPSIRDKKEEIKDEEINENNEEKKMEEI